MDIQNPYGHFSDDGREFVITDPRTPAPWINYSWNDGYAALVSHTGGGFSFYVDPRDNRILRQRYNGLPWDRPGRYLYVRDRASGAVHSLTWCPTETLDYDFYECRHGQGYTTITTERGGIRGAVTYFVPRTDPAELWQIELTNTGAETRELDLFSYAELILGNALNDLINQPNDKHFSDVQFDAELQALMATRHYWVTNRGVSVAQPNQAWPYVLAVGFVGAEVASFDGGREAFIGRWRSESNPIGIEKGKLSGSEITHGDPCAALHTAVTLAPGETKKLTVILAMVPKETAQESARELLATYRADGAVESALEEVRRYWTSHLDTLQVETPDEILNVMLNVWLRYQTAVTFDMARNAGYYHGGLLFGTGIRDQMQDLWGDALLAEPNRVRERIIEVLGYQFADGSTLHNFFRIVKAGEKTGHSDTPLWVPFGIMCYLRETGDLAFLDQTVKFYDGGEGTVREHLARAFDYVLSELTERGLPKFGPGDWNDTLDYVGRGGKGETMWGAGFLAAQLRDAVELFRFIGDQSRADGYQSAYDRLAATVNELCWDGDWYVRGFKDSGDVIGSAQNTEGRIFINAQSWMVISGIAPEARGTRALESVAEHLDTDKGPQLLGPAYRTVDPTIGLATRCVPGKKENGAIFNHAAAWLVLAEWVAGNGDRAWSLQRRMLPPVVGQDADRYLTEPYVTSEYVTSPEHPTFGEASHSWLTGSGVWTYRNCLDWLLGMRPTYDGLLLDPCLPSDWPGFKATRRFRGGTYQIEVTNPNSTSGRGLVSLTLDGVAHDPSQPMPVPPPGTTIAVRAVMR